jgi:hypothetical protein
MIALLALLFLGTLSAQEVLRNDSIIKLVRSGLSEDVIVNVVKTQPGQYSLSAEDLLSLKRAGVSEKIIAAMQNKMATGPTPAPKVPAPVAPPEATERPVQRSQLTTSGTRVEAHPTPTIPKEHGLYYQASNGLVPIEGQVISFARTGSRLSSAATFGIKSAKTNVQILGDRSAHTSGSRPVFYYRAASGTESAGGSAGDLVLVRMRVKHKRRQFEVAAGGAWRASSGISIRSQLQVTRKRIEPDLYRLAPADELKPGQYALYLFRGYDLPGFVYDFSVE